MGLATLEFSDCITDSPYFRDKLHQHEKEIERTSKAIKSLIAQGKELLQAARNLSASQRKFAQNLKDFHFECIGEQQTDDEQTIAESLRYLGNLIDEVENARDTMLDHAQNEFIQSMESFRKEHIGKAKEERKKFEKQTRNYCQSVEKHLALKTSKVSDNSLQESDAQLDMERRQFHHASMHYVLCLQEVQERKKFEFVETILRFMYGWFLFYHQGHEVSEEYNPCVTDLQLRIQKLRENFVNFRWEGEKLMNKILSVRCQTRDNFDVTREESEHLMNKILEVRGTKPQDAPVNKRVTREGYLFLQEKKALTTTWSKYYCEYKKEKKSFSMVAYNQASGSKVVMPEPSTLSSCVRRASDSIDKRFCFDITLQDKPGTLTLQALSEDDRRLWLDAMDGKEPIYQETQPQPEREYTGLLDEVGFNFVTLCITSIEKRGLSDQGLYRVVGVSSKVNKLTTMGLDRRKAEKLDLDKDGEWEVKTITSALKTYFRTLPEPLMTFSFHDQFIEAAKLSEKENRIQAIHSLLYQLPSSNFRMLEVLVKHLHNVASNSQQNLMTVANIGVCFGPTLLRPQEETMAAIMNIKFCNIIVEIMIDNYDKLFKCPPDVNANSKLQVVGPVEIDLKFSANSVPVDRGDNIPSEPSREDNYAKRGSGGSDSLDRGDNSSTPTPNSSATSTPSLNNSTPKSPRQTYAEARAKLRPSTIYNPSSSGGTGYSPRYSYTGEGFSTSNSSSSESLNSRTSSNMTTSMPSYVLQSTPRTDEVITRRTPVRQKNVIANRVTAYNQHLAKKDWKPDRASEPVVYQNLGGSLAKTGSDGNMYQNIGPGYLISSDSNNDNSTTQPEKDASLPKPNQTRAKPTVPLKPKNSLRLGAPFQALKKRIPNESVSSSTSSLSSVSNSTPRRKVMTLYACEAENDSELSFEPNEIVHNVRPSKEPGWLEGTYKGRQGLIPENYVKYID